MRQLARKVDVRNLGCTRRATLVFLVFVGLFLSGFLFPNTSAWALAVSPQKVLLINSYHPSFPTFFKQIDGIRARFEEAGYTPETLVFDIEYMDTKRFPYEPNIDRFRDNLATKLLGRKPYDVVLVSDDNALDFVLKHQATIFKNSPLVFLGINNVKLATSLNTRPGVTGVVEAISLSETLTSIETMRPNSNDLIVVAAANRSSRENLASLEKQKFILKRMKVEVLSLMDLTYQDLAERLKILPNDASILLLGAYRDRIGTTKTYLQGLNFVSEYTDAPIFSLWEHGLGFGVLGGKLISHFEQGRVAADLATKILRGGNASELPVVTSSPNVFTFDFNVMKKYGIATSDLPTGSKILNLPKTWLEENQALVPWMITFFVLQFFVIGFLVVNVTRRRRAEKRALESEGRFKELAMSSSDWIWEMDADLRFTYFSNRYEHVTGLTIRDRIGTKRFDKIPTEVSEYGNDHLAKHLDDLENHRPFRDFEYATTFTKDSAVRWLRISGVPIFDKARNFVGYRGTGSDIGEEIKARRAISDARHQAEVSNRAKSEFLAHMSHELRTPLNGIIGFSQIMDAQLYGPLGSEKYKEYAADIRQAGTHLLALLNDILDLSRIEAGAMVLKETDFEISQTVNETLRLLDEVAIAQKVILSSSIPESIPKLRGDERRIKQLFINVLTNAIKFTEPGGTVEINAELAKDKGLDIRVLDTGIGIPHEFMDRVREPFGRVEGSMERSFEGVGLGLPIVESIMTLHGGTLEIESTSGEGTVIHLKFPKECIVSDDPGIANTNA